MSLELLRRMVSQGVWKRSVQVQHRIVKLENTGNLVTALVRGTEEPLHTCQISLMGDYWCSCEGFFTHDNKLCSHLLAIFRRMEMDGIPTKPYVEAILGLSDVNMPIVETSLKGYNRLFGGLRKKRMNAIFGKPDSGKSLLNLQFATDLVKREGCNAFIVDFEGGFEEEWLTYFLKDNPDLTLAPVVWNTEIVMDDETEYLKFSYDLPEFLNTKKNTIYLWDCRSFLPIFAFHGRPLKFKIKGGVKEPIDDETKMVTIEKSPMGQFIEKANIGYLSYDSVSNPIESYFTGGQINWRTRAKATLVWMSQAQKILDKYGIVIMSIIHATKNTDMRAKIQPVGGKALMHNQKYISYVKDYYDPKLKGKPNWESLRKIEIYRHQMKEPGDECTVMITNCGFIDYPS